MGVAFTCGEVLNTLCPHDRLTTAYCPDCAIDEEDWEMKIELTPEQEDKIVEKWLVEARDLMLESPPYDDDGKDEELAASCDKVLRLNWGYKYG